MRRSRMSRFLVTILALWLGIGSLVLLPHRAAQAGPTAPGANPLHGVQRIDADRAAGKIRLADALLYKALLLKGGQLLPREYQLDGILKDATQLVLDVETQLDKVDPQVQAYLRYLLAAPASRKKQAPPTLKSIPLARPDLAAAAIKSQVMAEVVTTTPQGNFKVHWQNSGSAASNLAYAQQVGQYFEESLAYYQAHGYSLPSLPFDVYIEDLGNGLYGVAYPATIFTDAYININKSFAWAPHNDDPAGVPTGAAKVTAAHEFFHQVQYKTMGLTATPGEGWWMESSATFMEDEVYDYVNDYYNYLPTFYQHTNDSLDAIGGGYETVLINKLLKHAFNGGNPDIIKSVLSGIGLTTSTEESMDAVLQTMGADLPELFHRFGLWNFFTGTRAQGGYYPEAAHYPTFNHFQADRSLGTAHPTYKNQTAAVAPMAAHYYRFTPEASLTDAKSVTVEAQREDADGQGWVVVMRPSGPEVHDLVFGADNKAKLRVGHFRASEVNELVVILTSGAEHGIEDFTYSVYLNRPLDLTFVIDTTGSMWDDIDMVKAAMSNIVDVLDREATDFRVAIAQYKDFPVYPYGEWSDFPYAPVTPFTNNRTAIVSGINTLSASGGYDWPEAVYSGVIRSINHEGLGDYRKDAQKAIIVMGDAPPHDPEPFTGYTMADLLAAAAAAGITAAPPAAPALPMDAQGTAADRMAAPDGAHLYTIAIGWDYAAYDYFRQMAEGTGGQVYRTDSASGVVNAILDAIGAAADDLTPPCDSSAPAALSWLHPTPPDAFNQPVGQSLSLTWNYASCAGFVRDESVVVVVRNHLDQSDPNYPIAAFNYPYDVQIDEPNHQYQLDFLPDDFGVAPGTVLEINVYYGNHRAGQVLVNVTS